MKGKNKLARGIISKAARHFGISHQAARKRLFLSFDPATVDYALKLDAEIKAKKAKTKNKIKKYINISEPA